MAKKRTAKRKNAGSTVAYLAPSITGISMLQWSGVVDAAQKHGVNLLSFVGASPRYPTGFSAQSNIVYDLVTPENVDGVVSWASTIGNYMTAEEIAAFHEHYRPLPVVSVGRALEGVPSLLMESYHGMREAVDHLIEVHGRRRVAFIRGPEGHFYAQERYRAYVESLEAHDIPFDPDLVTSPGSWGTETATAAMRLLLDERGLRPPADIDAIAAANDGLIIIALEVLQARGIGVPDDVALVGFDDTVYAQTSTPPVTSVAPAFREVGYQAAETLLALMKGEQVPQKVDVPSKLMVRRSCGCLSPAVAAAAAETAERPSKEMLQEAATTRRMRWLSAVVQAVGQRPEEAISEWAGQLLDSFAAEVQGGKAPGSFLAALEDVLRQVVAVGEAISTDPGQYVDAWQSAVSVLRRNMLPYLKEEARAQAEGLWRQANVLIGQTAQRARARQMQRAEGQADTLREIEESLVTASNVGELADVLAQSLPRLGIPSCYLSLYENPAHYEYPQPAPEWSRLVLAYDADLDARRVELGPEGRRFPTRRLVPDGMLPQDRWYSFVVVPLYMRESQLGFALFEVGPRDAAVYEALRQGLCGALHAALLVQRTREYAVRLQTAAEVSRTASSILDPDKLIQQVVDLMQERLDLYYAGLFLVDEAGSEGEPGGKWAVLRAATGEAGRRMLAQGHRLEVGGESMIGWCVANRQARIALDVGVEAVRFDNPFLPETRSELALPLVSRGQAIGALTIQSAQEAAFSDEDISVLQTMADQLANVIQNARLFEEQQRASSLLSGRIRELDLLNEIGRRIDESPQVSDFLRWVAEHLPSAMQFSEECVAAIELEGQVYGASEAVGLPRQMVGGLRIGGERIGQVTVAYTGEREFRDEESALLGDVVRRLSGYVENRRLFEQMQDALREVEATQRRYLEQAWSGYLKSAKVTAYETEIPGREPLGDTLLPEVRQAVEQRGVMAVTGDGGAAEERSALVAPITLRGVVIGALGIHDENARQWTEEEVVLIEAVAERVALAVENLRLLDETQRRAAREQAVAEVSARISESLDLEKVLMSATSEMRRTLGLDDLVVRLIEPKAD
ncbi:MAG: substrate-binding domain-containing protein [Anaerolineae bacterium]|nr:substrate-binding domain-containing protein [Anaerolineae bacterium]